ncbi:MAG: hypothetical protein IPM39_27455 [Chloroflexi bacterium]|nr:hypothetical protein [Chloroflexota bacterium]
MTDFQTAVSPRYQQRTVPVSRRPNGRAAGGGRYWLDSAGRAERAKVDVV